MKLCKANPRHIVGKCEARNDFFIEFLLPLGLQLGVFQHGEGKALVAQCLGSISNTHGSGIPLILLSILIPLLTEEEIKPQKNGFAYGKEGSP